MKLADCPVRTTLRVLGGKWKPTIIKVLTSGARGYGQLRRMIPEATKKVLTAQLRDLESDGILRRDVSVHKIVRVDYSLTDYGWTIVPVLEAMSEWGRKHRGIGLCERRGSEKFPKWDDISGKDSQELCIATWESDCFARPRSGNL